MNSFFCNVLIFRSSRSQIFFKIDVLENFPSFTGKHLCWSLFLKTLQALRPQMFSFEIGEVFLWTVSFTEHLQWLLLWSFQKNNVIFGVIMTTLGYNQKFTWKYCNYYHPYKKISIFYQKHGRHLVQKCCTLSRQSPNFMTLSSIYNFNIFKGDGVSHPIVIQCIL